MVQIKIDLVLTFSRLSYTTRLGHGRGPGRDRVCPFYPGFRVGPGTGTSGQGTGSGRTRDRPVTSTPFPGRVRD
jgi:hypothetical protein